MNNKSKIQIIIFLALTFGITTMIAYLIKLGSGGLSISQSLVAQFSIMGAMFVPGIVAMVVMLVSGEKLSAAGLGFGGKKYYIEAWLTILFFYVLVYTITSFFYAPDFSLKTFTEINGLELPGNVPFIIMIVALASLFVSPIINFIPALGEEFGWRGFLLRKLLPLGKNEALIISGIIWGLWHTPFIFLNGFGYGGFNLYLGSLIFIVIITLLGIYIGRTTLDSGSVFVASFMHAVFNAHSYGIWAILFAGVNPIYGGIAGLTGVVVLTPLALRSLYAQK